MHISFQEYPRQPVVVNNISVKFMRQSRFIPLKIEEGLLKVAMADPDDFYIIDALKLACGLNVDACRGREDEILDAIERLYGAGSQSLETIIEEAGKGVYDVSSGGIEDADHLRDLASEAPIIRLVNRLILNAVDTRASDIHFEPFEHEFKVRYRIDGILHEVESPPNRLQAAIISRVKIMAKLDIAERRLPQDGRIKLKSSDKENDFRVATLPKL
jgi:general secretion pathway protein E